MLLINNLKKISLKILPTHILALPQCCQEMRYIGIRLHVFPLACLEQKKLAANQPSLQCSNYINKEASTVLCSVEYFFLLLECSTAFCVLYNRTERIRESSNFLMYSAKFSNFSIFFQWRKSGVSLALFFDKAR